MTVDVRNAVARIVEILEGVEYSGTSKFEHVYVGEPLGLPIQSPLGALAAVWFTGESQKQLTLGNVMVTSEWRVRMYWRLPATEEDRRELEFVVAEACRTVQAAFRADSKLTYLGADTVTDLDVGLASGGYIDVRDEADRLIARYRMQEFDLQLVDLEGEAISA